MAKPVVLRMWVVGAAVGLMATLFIVPTTRGMLRVQLGMVGLGRDPITNPIPIQDTAASRPRDFEIQLAAAGSNQPAVWDANYHNFNPDVKLPQLMTFDQRFPLNPSTYANTLRWLTSVSLCSSRPENDLIEGHVPSKRTSAKVPTAYYAYYDSTAAKGEQLDPNNAYFPFMRAIGLFGQYRDAEALAELHKAAVDHSWREYYEDEVYGGWKASELQTGTESAVVRASLSAAVVFPHYSGLRSVARIATYKAMAEERAGNYSSGLAIRVDIIRCGSLMRSQCKSVIGSLVGMAITNVGTLNPGGTIKTYNSRSPSDRAIGGEQRHKDFCAYLVSHGHSELAPALNTEYKSGLAVKHLLSSSSLGTDELQKLEKSLVLMAIDLVLLASAAILTLSGIVTLAAVSWRRILDFHPAVRATVVIAALGAIVIVAMATSGTPSPTVAFPGLQSSDVSGTELTSQEMDAIEIVIAITAVILMVVVSAVLALRSGERGMRRIYVPLAYAFATCGAVYLIVRIATFEIMKCYSLAASGSQQNSTILLIVTCGVLGLPILLVIASTVVAICKKTPVWRGVLSGLSEWAVPLAGLVILFYGCSFMMTIKSDENLNQMVQQILSGESNYYAKASGQYLPGPVRWPDEPGSVNSVL